MRPEACAPEALDLAHIYADVGRNNSSQQVGLGRLSIVTNPSISQTDIDGLYRQYVTMLRHSTRRVLRDTAMAEDVVQETFVRFIDYAKANEVRHAGALLYKIAMRLAVKKLRKSYNHLEIKEYVEPAVSTGSGPEDRIAITKVLALSNEEEAQIALMYYVDGLQQDEIAAILDIPRRTISHRIQSFCERAARLLQRQHTSSSTADTKAYHIEIAKPLSVQVKS